MAKVQVLFSRDFEPDPPVESSRKDSKGRMGWETESMWLAKAPRAEVRLSYWTYAKGKKPLMSPKELATELYSNSELVDEKDELTRRYFDRKVIDAKLGPFPATIDLHLDKEENRHWGLLAFGNDEEQWLVEIKGDAALDGMDRAVRTIIASVKPMTTSYDALAKGLMKMVALPGTGFEIAAPTCLAARVPYAETGRPKLWASKYVLELGDEFSITVHDNAYSDKKQPNLKADVDYLQGEFRNGFRELGKAEDLTSTVDGWTTFTRILPYTQGGKKSTIVWTYWASPGRTIFAVVNISDRLNGATSAREIAKSLRPVKKPSGR